MDKGIYRFYIDGELIHQEENALTFAGRSIAIKSLLGIIPKFANSIAYGVGESQNTLTASSRLITNNSLQFEIGRTSVTGGSLRISDRNDILLYTGVIDDPDQFNIYEVGLFPAILEEASLGINGSTLFNFDKVESFTKFGTASATALLSTQDARIGSQLLSLPQTDGVSDYLEYNALDQTIAYVDSYISLDTFRLAGLDTNSSTASVIFRFYSDSTNYYDLLFTTPSSSGYFISETEKGSAIKTGSPEWENITSVRIWQNGSDFLYLDGLRIDIGSYLLDTNFGMISRSVLASPVNKPPSVPVTIEYSLALDFNFGL